MFIPFFFPNSTIAVLKLVALHRLRFTETACEGNSRADGNAVTNSGRLATAKRPKSKELSCLPFPFLCAVNFCEDSDCPVQGFILNDEKYINIV
jgi:hypothetical protein